MPVPTYAGNRVRTETSSPSSSLNLTINKRASSSQFTRILRETWFEDVDRNHHECATRPSRRRMPSLLIMDSLILAVKHFAAKCLAKSYKLGARTQRPGQKKRGKKERKKREGGWSSGVAWQKTSGNTNPSHITRPVWLRISQAVRCQRLLSGPVGRSADTGGFRLLFKVAPLLFPRISDTFRTAQHLWARPTEQMVKMIP